MSTSIYLANIGAFATAYGQSDLFGKLVILSLLSVSLICWVVLIHKIWMTRQVTQASRAFQLAFDAKKEHLFNLDLTGFPKPKSALVPHPYELIFKELKSKTAEILNKNFYFASQQGATEKKQVYLSPADLEIVESHVLTTISTQVKHLEKNLFILSTITTLAPFLGLLGTVWGILVSFSGLQAGASAGSNAAVLGGLSTALATTVLGLIIAIPALISYNYLKHAIKNYASDMEDFLYQLLSSVELQYRKADVT